MILQKMVKHEKLSVCGDGVDVVVSTKGKGKAEEKENENGKCNINEVQVQVDMEKEEEHPWAWQLRPRQEYEELTRRRRNNKCHKNDKRIKLLTRDQLALRDMHRYGDENYKLPSYASFSLRCRYKEDRIKKKLSQDKPSFPEDIAKMAKHEKLRVSGVDALVSTKGKGKADEENEDGKCNINEVQVQVVDMEEEEERPWPLRPRKEYEEMKRRINKKKCHKNDNKHTKLLTNEQLALRAMRRYGEENYVFPSHLSFSFRCRYEEDRLKKQPSQDKPDMAVPRWIIDEEKRAPRSGGKRSRRDARKGGGLWAHTKQNKGDLSGSKMTKLPFTSFPSRIPPIPSLPFQ